MNCFVLNFLYFRRTLLKVPIDLIKIAIKLLFVYWPRLIPFPCLVCAHMLNLKKFLKGSTEINLLNLPLHLHPRKLPRTLHRAYQLALSDKDLHFLKSFYQVSFHK